MRVLPIEGDEADLGIERLAVFVEVPILPARDVGVVRMAEGYGQAPRPRIRLVGMARQLVELLRREEGDLVVIFDLVGGFGDAGAGDRAEIVVPPVDALAGLAVVGRPAEIGRVDVGGEPLLEAVQLVGADEMHLAGQARVVAGGAQMMRVGRDVGSELGGIVVDAGARRQLPAHEGGAARRAERRGGVVVGEARGARGQRLEMRHVQEVGRPIRKQRSVELVDHDDQDVGASAHRAAACPSLVSTKSSTRAAALAGLGRPSFSARLI